VGLSDFHFFLKFAGERGARAKRHWRLGALAEGVAEGQCIGVTSGQMIAKPV